MSSVGKIVFAALIIGVLGYLAYQIIVNYIYVASLTFQNYLDFAEVEEKSQLLTTSLLIMLY